MFAPRNLVIAGLALIVLSTVGIATGSTHVFWAFVGLAWVFGPRRCAGGRRHQHLHQHPDDHAHGYSHDCSRPRGGEPAPDPSRDATPAAPVPDPTLDHHVAFPKGR